MTFDAIGPLISAADLPPEPGAPEFGLTNPNDNILRLGRSFETRGWMNLSGFSADRFTV